MDSKNSIDNETQIIFLAIFWGGGGPYTISQIIHVYDWINRAIPTKRDLQTALNTLLALKLIEKEEDRFKITAKAGKEFDEFRKKKRKRKFETMKMYFSQLQPVPKPLKTVKLSERAYKSALQQYHEFMRS